MSSVPGRRRLPSHSTHVQIFQQRIGSFQVAAVIRTAGLSSVSLGLIIFIITFVSGAVAVRVHHLENALCYCCLVFQLLFALFILNISYSSNLCRFLQLLVLQFWFDFWCRSWLWCGRRGWLRLLRFLSLLGGLLSVCVDLRCQF